MKTLNIILAVLFLLFAGLQLNDEPGDVWLWVCLYAGVGIISGLAAFGKYNMWLIVLGLAVVVYEMFRKFPAFAQWIGDDMPSITGEMHASTPYIEYAREYFGLLLCLAVLIFHYIMYARQRSHINEA